jgi:hypothetical protein
MTPEDVRGKPLIEYDTPPPPCDDCRLQRRCATNRLACLAFCTYSASGRFNQSAARKPTHSLYLQAMRSGEGCSNTPPIARHI